MLKVARLDVISSGARRRWTLDEKQRIVAESYAAPRQVWDRKQDAAYENPGTPVAKRDGAGGRGGGGRGGGGGGLIIQRGDYVFLTGEGATPDGDRPFLERLTQRARGRCLKR